MTKNPVASEDLERMAGKCLKIWTLVEIELCRIFVHLNGQHAEPAKPIGIAFDAIRSLETRLAVLNTLVIADPQTDDGRFREAWHSIYLKIMRLAKKRNEVAHFGIFRNQLAGKRQHLAYLLHPFSTVTNWYSANPPHPLSFDMLEARASAFQHLYGRLCLADVYVRALKGIGGETARQTEHLAHLLQPPRVRMSVDI